MAARTASSHATPQLMTLRTASASTSVLPAIVSYGQRRRRGQEAIESRDDLDYAGNFLWLTFGDEPEPAVVDAFNRSMILYAEHSFNASTFTTRVIASTTADLYSAVVGAIGALKGPLHGGAPARVLLPRMPTATSTRTGTTISTTARDARPPAKARRAGARPTTRTTTASPPQRRTAPSPRAPVAYPST